MHQHTSANTLTLSRTSAAAYNTLPPTKARWWWWCRCIRCAACPPSPVAVAHQQAFPWFGSWPSPSSRAPSRAPPTKVGTSGDVSMPIVSRMLPTTSPPFLTYLSPLPLPTLCECSARRAADLAPQRRRGHQAVDPLFKEVIVTQYIAWCSLWSNHTRALLAENRRFCRRARPQKSSPVYWAHIPTVVTSLRHGCLLATCSTAHQRISSSQSITSNMVSECTARFPQSVGS